jgi:hypothetical protein
MSDEARTRRRILCAALATILLLPVPAWARPKVDRVVLRNGDGLLGEVVSLLHGRLTFKTDSMGTITIEWPDVVAIDTKYQFTIETTDGQKLEGALGTAPDSSSLIIEGPRGEMKIGRSEIAQLTQLDRIFWNRIDGSFSVGFNYAKATEILLLQSRLDTKYRATGLVVGLEGAANVSRSEDSDTQEAYNLGTGLRLLRSGERFWGMGLSWERNQDLGIKGRVQLMGGVGWYLHRGAESEVATFVGLNGNQEWEVGAEESEQKPEALFGADLRIFRFRDPETSLVTDLMIKPSLTQSGRYRVSYDLTLSREIVSDLTTDLSYYADYDSEPPQDAEKLDSGVSISIGYKF